MEKYKYFVNKECEFFPCHKGIEEKDWSCLFCYCPLYHDSDCGGSFTINEQGTKDCIDCKLPHRRESWQYIVRKLTPKDKDVHKITPDEKK